MKLYGWEDQPLIGDDIVIGGAGQDTFLYAAARHSRPAGADVIKDFDSAVGDVIDLHYIDADTTTAGNQAFTFIGNAAFGTQAAELRYDATVFRVEADTNGDSIADFAIDMNGLTTIITDEFLR